MNRRRERELREPGRRLQPSETPPWAPEPVMSPDYWAERLRQSDGEVHRAIFAGALGQYQEAVAEMRAEVLAARIGPRDSVLDVGCGFGVLPGWLAEAGWSGGYLGVDVCPEFVALARAARPGLEFAVGDARRLAEVAGVRRFDWAVAVWLREMVRKNVGPAAWEEVEAQMRLCAGRILVVR
jgi:SAM-dependent methyltransferase